LHDFQEVEIGSLNLISYVYSSR